jgi:predicted DsbA family dithiol-disulfide isomerase
MPKEGMDRKEYRTAKFGSWERSLALDAQIKTVGESEGLVFAPEKSLRTPNTLDAHRLIWLAEKEGVQDAVVEALFRAYFTEGEDIGDTPTLLDVVASAGLNRARAEAMLNSDEGLATIREEDEQARTVGVQGVPFFIINNSVALSGAREPSAFLEAFEIAAAESVTNTEGETCEVGAKGAAC